MPPHHPLSLSSRHHFRFSLSRTPCCIAYDQMGHFLQFGHFYINLRRGWERNCSVQAVMKWKEKMVWRPQRDVDSESESKKREMVSRHHQLISVCSRTWKAARLSSEVVSLSHASRLSPQSMAQRVGHRCIQMIYRTELLFLDVWILGQTFLRHIVSYIQPDSSNKFWTCPGFWGYCYFFVRPGAKVVKPFWHFCNGSGNRNKHAGRWNLPSVRNLPPPPPLGETWLWIQLLRILHSVISNKGFALPSRVNSSCSCINNYMVGVHQPPWQTYCSKCHHGRWKFPAIASFQHFSILWLLRQVKAIN